MYSASKSQRGVANKALGVGWYYHFPKDFLRPYGYGTDGISDDIKSRKLTSTNTSFLNRPSVAMSYLAETVIANIDVVDEFVNLQPASHRFKRKLNDQLMKL